MRRPIVIVAWCLATTGACALAWTAVDQVAARVTDRTPVVGDSSIRAALRAGSRTASADAPGSLRPGAPSDPRGGDGGITGTGPGTGSSPSHSPPGSRGDTESPPPAPPPPTTTTTSPPTPTNASVLVIGGSVTASCASGTPTLIAAIPTNGFGVTVSRGSQLLVDFTSSTHHSIVEAECSDGQIQWSTGEEAAN